MKADKKEQNRRDKRPHAEEEGPETGKTVKKTKGARMGKRRVEKPDDENEGAGENEVEEPAEVKPRRKRRAKVPTDAQLEETEEPEREPPKIATPARAGIRKSTKPEDEQAAEKMFQPCPLQDEDPNQPYKVEVNCFNTANTRVCRVTCYWTRDSIALTIYENAAAKYKQAGFIRAGMEQRFHSCQPFLWNSLEIN